MASYYYYMEFYPSNCTYEYSRFSHKKSWDPQEMLRLIFSQFSSVFVSQKQTQTILLKNIRRGITNLKCYSRNLKNVSKFFCETPFNDVVGFDCKKRQFCKNALHCFQELQWWSRLLPWGPTNPRKRGLNHCTFEEKFFLLCIEKNIFCSSLTSVKKDLHRRLLLPGQ